jgi:response regulator RpfG family c-di-GMP phosphodiesterase
MEDLYKELGLNKDSKKNADRVINVLYVDDELINLKAFNASFRRIFNVFTARDAQEGRKMIEENEIHIVITDQRMPNTTGVEFLESILDDYPDAMRILMTGFSNIQAVIDSINKGQVYSYVTKPWNDEELRSTIEKAFEVYSLREENKVLTESLLQANKQLEFMLRQKLLD